ncbi:L-threonylcarbamoyladenylate synthase [candidate division CSSED10-310 bacterium]|uniref:L-threonylcarbamoyladenylate synthase n=1 Tax=candidate division CSSED10-310 bacterium TaxID=2855610 RepID=A0ABV6YZ92_UNCC1
MMKPEVISINTKQKFSEFLLRKIESVLMHGGLLICPTESSYLLGANAWDDEAVSSIYQLKKRDLRKPLPIVVKDVSAARKLVSFNSLADKIVAKFWPGPLTVILPIRPANHKKFYGEKGTIGLRVSSFPVLQQILIRINIPLISTSANISGHQEPYSPLALTRIEATSLQKIKLILDAGTLPANPPSTVIDISRGSLSLVREGAIPFEKITSAVSRL